jgi:hypothetical protein
MQDRHQDDTLRDGEIEPITITVFILIVFLIVPFTMLSPFRYPQPSALDEALKARSITLALRAGGFEQRTALQRAAADPGFVAASKTPTSGAPRSLSQ